MRLSYCFFVVDSSDITFYRNRTRQIVCYCWSVRRHCVCPTNRPLMRTAKIERSTLLHLPQFYHHQICYTHSLLLYKVLFTPPSSTNTWKLIPYMTYQRGSPAQKNCTVLFIVQNLSLLTTEEFSALDSAVARLNYIVSAENRDRL